MKFGLYFFFLKGGVAQIVAAHKYEEGQRNVMSLGLSSPGTLYSKLVFY